MALLVADIYQAAGLIRQIGERIASGEGQSQARWQLLSVLSDEPRTVSQAARRLGIARQAVQRVADDLTRGGLLVAGRNPDHRTSPLFALTAQGKDVLVRMNAAAACEHREQLKAMSPAALTQLRDGLRELITILERR
jgi:DNA-binding MarR family transcriptional regulator